jgi:hypothetical protein
MRMSKSNARDCLIRQLRFQGEINNISTVRDAMIQNRDAKEAVAFMLEFQELSKKIKLWEKKVQKFGGEVQVNTLEKFKKQLAALK